MLAHSNTAERSVLLSSQVIGSRRDFDRLVEGYSSLHAISYVVSPELLLDLFQKGGLSEAEVIVGDSLTGASLAEHFRESLRRKGKHVTRTLAEFVEQGRLRIWLPRRTIHSKLFILRGQAGHRLIQGSANLTETARQAAHQINYVWYADVSGADPWLTRVLGDYEAHRRECQLFMGELAELLRTSDPGEKDALIEAWLHGSAGEPDGLESREVLQDLAARSLQHVRPGADPIFTISLPEAPRARREVDRVLAPLGLANSDHHVTVDAHAYLRYVEQTHPVPLMRLGASEPTLELVLGGRVSARAEPLPDPSLVDAALAHLESYLATVDWGRSLDPQFAKASLLEALLYVLSSPFAHEHMKARRRAYALIDRRGPQALYIFGPSQNGKSTFLRFALQLLAGQHVSPVPGAEFGKNRVLSASSVGTVFPLAFDDVDLRRKSGTFEEILKSYWENWWREEYPTPQLIFTGNADSLKDWAKSRVKRIDFDVQFVPTEKQKAALNRIIEQHNPIFVWFASVYLAKLREGITPTEDELATARDVMKELYEFARRSLPPFFPDRPLEQTYDPGRKVWRDLIFGLQKATIARQGHRLLVTFKDEMQYAEIRGALGHLPQTVKHQLKGKTVVIESPAEFEAWLNPGQSNHTHWFWRWFQKIGVYHSIG